MKHAAKFTFTHSKSRTQNIINPPEKKIFGTSSILARGKSRVLSAPFLHSVNWFELFGGITARVVLARVVNALSIIIFARYCIMIEDIPNTKGK